MIVFSNVTLRYHYDDFDVLRGASFELHEGVNTILADAQSGKSSICKLLLRDVAPTSGQIIVDGQQIDSIPNSSLDILYLPSKPVFFEKRSVQYNVEYPLRIRKVARAERQERVQGIAEQFGLNLDAKVKLLSPSERRTLALARGLTVKRKIALFDSFFDADELSLEHINSILQRFDTCVVLTSDPCIAMGHTVVLDGGEVVYQGDAVEAQQRVSELYWLAHQ